MIKSAIQSPSVLILTLLMAASQAEAGRIDWTLQLINTNPGGNVYSMSIGNGARWPAVFYDTASQYGNLMAASMTPAGWISSNLGATHKHSYAKSSSASDGRVGVVWRTTGAIQFTQSSNLGWSTSTVASVLSTQRGGGLDVAYRSDNRPVVAYHAADHNIKVSTYDGHQWDADTVDSFAADPYGELNSDYLWVSTAIDSEDRIGVVYSGDPGENVYLSIKDPYTGNWDGGYVPLLGQATAPSLAFGPNDEPHVMFVAWDGYSEVYGLKVASFNIQAGEWQTSTVTSNSGRRSKLVFNSQGHMALAYITGSLPTYEIHYCVNDGNGWVDHIVPTDPGLEAISSTPILAFDPNDLPVIAYQSNMGMVLAYDPIVAPEPASLLIFLAGWTTRRRRGRRT